MVYLSLEKGSYAMNDKNAVLAHISNDFNLERIKNLSLPEKFKLVHFIKLIHKEAEFAEANGITSLNKSPNYTKNKTYNLFAMLVVNGTRFDVIEEIVANYARNFRKSDIYYSQVSLLGIGVMLIMNKFKPEAILNYLMLLLGEEFLTDNLKYDGFVDKDLDEEMILDAQIVYKPFEGKIRALKYDLLALLKLGNEKGIDYVKDIINNSYDNKLLAFYFNMMNVDCEDTVQVMYKEFKLNSSRTERLMMTGAYAILHNCDVFNTHYVFNSIIGKYSRYNKDSNEIEDELETRLKMILENYNK